MAVRNGGWIPGGSGDRLRCRAGPKERSPQGSGRRRWRKAPFAKDSPGSKGRWETGGGRGLSGLHWAWCIGRGPHLQLRQEPQGTSDFRLRSQGPCRLGTGESGLVLGGGMELRLPLEMSPGREAACRAVFGTWGFFRTMHGKTAPSC